jgi:replication factor A1
MHTSCSRAQSDSKYIRVSELQPYLPGFTIRVRVSNKSDIKEWNNQKGATKSATHLRSLLALNTLTSSLLFASPPSVAGNGKLFSADLCDASGEIRATGFNEQAVMLHDKLQVGKVYIIHGGKIKPGNQRFNQLNNKYELSFNEHTTAEEVLDAQDVPWQQVCRDRRETQGDQRKMMPTRELLSLIHVHFVAKAPQHCHYTLSPHPHLQ